MAARTAHTWLSGVQIPSCRALANLAVKNLAEIVAAGGIRIVLAAMTEHMELD